MALTLTVLLLAPFSLEYFWDQWQSRKLGNNIGALKWTIPLFASLLLIHAIDGLDLKTNKIEVKEAGEWIAKTLPTDKYHIYSNNPLLLHYAGKNPAHYYLHFHWKELDDLLVTKRIYDFDYAAITLTKDIQITRDYISRVLLMEPAHEKMFENNRTVLIYKLHKEKNEEPFNTRYLKIQ